LTSAELEIQALKNEVRRIDLFIIAEDQSRLHKGRGTRNMAAVRHFRGQSGPHRPGARIQAHEFATLGHQAHVHSIKLRKNSQLVGRLSRYRLGR
jgi:hypothetical protein